MIEDEEGITCDFDFGDGAEERPTPTPTEPGLQDDILSAIKTLYDLMYLQTDDDRLQFYSDTHEEGTSEWILDLTKNTNLGTPSRYLNLESDTPFKLSLYIGDEWHEWPKKVEANQAVEFPYWPILKVKLTYDSSGSKTHVFASELPQLFG